MAYSDYVKFSPVNLTYEEWTNQEARRLANTLKTTNLINVKYDYDSTCELEFYKDGKEIFVRNVKARKHIDFNNNEVIQEILKNADDEDIEIMEKIK